MRRRYGGVCGRPCRGGTRGRRGLLRLGSYPIRFREDPIVFLRPHRIEPLESLTAQAVDLELNLDPEIDRLYTGRFGQLVLPRAEEVRLASFDAKNPFGRGTATPGWRRSSRRPELTTANVRPLAGGTRLPGHVRRRLDVPLGRKKASADLVSVYASCPAARSRPCRGTSAGRDPHAGRKRSDFRLYRSTIPWPVRSLARVNMPAGCRLDRLGSGPTRRRWTAEAEGMALERQPAPLRPGRRDDSRRPTSSCRTARRSAGRITCSTDGSAI